ncbi:hypothetical protein KL930_002406 [Ogataea haglerorum]|uniref:Allantoin permease n=1 Tax=Ogataea haglerorum TaxID=1937702 RepID=A0ABQ7RII3_9ASCO|nr:hypothetical protein KL915_002406 [Ogataea haglerorum]KAG7707813.1 hypothetical protein KL914_002634 [Ogataea haglerorum]KAG7709850.1 hypothetical protein KL950_002069 [Ogataea haglerorum]KAG7719929.1 hypothetical protein KL913_001898 [Ogataea haglerorum]KAG7721776.1 hypothetical protein KL949_001508 [Ogataea haglerorum]
MDRLRRLDQLISIRDDSENDPDQLRSNHDLKPTPPKERTWEMYNYFIVWFQNSLTVTAWNTGPSLVLSTGLDYRQVIYASLIASFWAALMVTASAWPGASYHIGYPVLARSVFGPRLAKFFVLARMFVAAMWFSVNTYNGAMCFVVCFRCVFGHRFVNLHNGLPASADITTAQMVVFFVFWVGEFSLMFLHPRQIRWFFTVKGILSPIACFGIFIFCMVKAGGAGNFDIEKGTLNTSTGNKWMYVFNSVAGALSPMIVNQPDIARYSKKKSHVLIPQAVGVILTTMIVLILGMACNSALKKVYGQSYWSIWDMFDAILDHEWSAKTRTAIFLCALVFSLSAAGTNVFANSIPFAADITFLVPRYFTIVRGQVFIGLLTWALVPWKTVNSAQTLLNFLSSYSIFMGPLLGCILSDFFVLRRGNLHVPSLYLAKPGSLYWKWHGCNMWGLFAWIISPVIALPGFVRLYHPNILNQTVSDIFNCGWLYTFLIGFTAYTILGLIFKPKIYPDNHADTPTTFEYMVPYNGFFEDDAPINGVGNPAVISSDASDMESGRVEEIKNDQILLREKTID